MQDHLRGSRKVAFATGGPPVLARVGLYELSAKFFYMGDTADVDMIQRRQY